MAFRALTAAVTAAIFAAAQPQNTLWQVVAPAQPLSPRAYSAVTLNAAQTSVLVLGGETGTPGVAAPLLTFSPTTGAATERADTTGYLFDRGATATSPSTATPPNTLYAFGGLNAAGVETSTLATFSTATNTWSTVTPTGGVAPSPRQLAAMTWVSQCAPPSDCLILVGGYGPPAAGQASVRLGDVWVFYTRNNTWASPAGAQVGRPPPGHSAAIAASPDGTQLYYYGGDTAAGASGDIFVLAPQGNAADLIPTDMVNVALGKAASQSSTWKISAAANSLAVASLAVDGNVADTLLVGGAANCAATNDTTTASGSSGVGEFNPWWMVDLGATTPFTAINIFTRDKNEAGPGRNALFQIWYGNSPTPPPSGPSTTAPPGGYLADGVTPANARCNVAVTDIADTQLLVPCAGSARYIFFYLPPYPTRTRYLELCEFQVLQVRPWAWRQLSGVANAALMKQTYQSSIYFNGAWAGDPAYAVDGILSSLWPYFSHTQEWQTDCNNIYWQVDLGAVFDVETLNVWTRLDCCAARRARIEVYIGNSQDWAQDVRVLGPMDITPAAGIFATYNVAARGRYVTFRKLPFDRTNCANAPGTPGGSATDDKNVLSLAEVQVLASTLLDQPAPRSGAAYAAYRGALVVVGGADASGVRLSDVRFFDMTANAWLPPSAPLGTAPVARTYAALLPLPNRTTAPRSSTALALVGGIDTAGDILSGVALLTFPACGPLASPYAAAPPGLPTGIATETCNSAGTVCVYTCANGYTAANPAPNMLICGPTGVWSGGVMPVCVPQALPTAVTAPVFGVVQLDGSLKVDWQPSTGGTWPADRYRVSVAPHDWVESFASGAFADPTVWRPAVPDQQQSNAYVFEPKTGELVLDGAPGAACASGQAYNCFTLYRDWPAAAAPTMPAGGSWALEAEMRMDDSSSRMAQNAQNIGIGIFDTGVWRPFSGRQLGVMHFYAGMRRNNNEWEYGWETLYSTWNTWSAEQNQLAGSTVFVRIERDAVARTWTAFFKFRAGDDWIRNPRTGYDALLINGTLTAPTSSHVKIGLVARTWGGTARCLGYFRYIRLVPLGACDLPGSTRIVPATACAGSDCFTSITGLAPGMTYVPRVEAGSVAGYAAPTAAGAVTTAPATPADYSSMVVPMIQAGQLVEVAAARAAHAVQPTVWANNPAGWGPSVVFDGDLGSYAQAGNPPQSNGDWWGIDLGEVAAIKSIYIVNRQNCCQQRTTALEWYVGHAPPPLWNENAQCPPGAYPVTDLLSPTPNFNPTFGYNIPYSGYFTCNLPGRYLFLRAPQSLGVQDAQDGQFNIAELRVYASNSCPPRNGTGVDVITPDLCAGGTYGSVCVHQCKAGFAPAAGSGVARCNGDEWDEPPLVCSPTCLDLPVVPYVGACLQTLWSETFPVGAEAAAEARWLSLSPITQEFESKWFVRDGHLEASTRVGCNDQMHAVIASDRVSGFYGDFTLTATVTTSDRAGLVFRARDDLNMYRFYLDTTLLAPVHVLERVTAGSIQRITDAPLWTAKPGSTHVVAVSMVGPVITVYVDGAPLMTASDGTFLAGAAGVFASTVATFSAVSFTAPCTGACSGAQNNETCTFGCHAGLVPVGPTTRTCVALEGATVNGFGVWSPSPATAPLTCTVPPVTFVASTVTVTENSPRNTDVGDPLLAQAAAPDYQLQFSVLSETPLDPLFGSLFYVDACSGQVRLRQGGPNVVNYERQANYTLLVHVAVAGFPASAAVQNITVRVLDVDEVPTVPTQFFNLTENSPPGTKVATLRAVDPERSVVSWVLNSDPTSGSFSLNGTTGGLTVVNGFDVTTGLGAVSVVTGYPVCADVPEQAEATLVCAPGYTITGIDFASFGTATGQCGNYSFGTCHAAKSLSVVSAACIGLNRCSVTSSDAVFIDPCFGVVKTLTVAVRCTPVAASSWLDFETRGAQPFMLTVTATQTNNAALFSVGTVWVQLVDANDPPVIVAGQAPLVVADSATANNLPLGNVSAFDEDRPTSAFFRPLTFTLVPPSAYAGTAACALPAGASLPTLTGLPSGVAIFTIDPATGILRFGAVPSYSAMLPFAALQFLARAYYAVCVNVTDGWPGSFGVGTVPVIVTAGVGSSAVISSFSGATTMATTGGENVVFTGSFPAGAHTFTATYAGGVYTYASPGCTATNGSSSVSCRTAPGVGAGLLWTVFMDGAPVPATAALLTSYRPPAVTSLLNATGVPTDAAAGTWVLSMVAVPGTFGPPGTTITVTYGAANEYVCAQVPRNDTQTVHRCVMAPGVGAGLPWAITIGGQRTTSLPNATISYAAPRIDSLVPACSPAPCAPNFNLSVGLEAAGGQVFSAVGANFGPATAALPAVSFGGPLGSLVTLTCARGAGAAAHTTLTCTAPAGTGIGHALLVVVGGQPPARGAFVFPVNATRTGGGSAAGLFYRSPTITRVYGAGVTGGPTTGGAVLYIEGTEFGPPTGPLSGVTSVRYGEPAPAGIFYDATATCVITSSTPALATMTCATVEGTGAGHPLQLTIGGLASPTFPAAISYGAPEISAYSGPGAAGAATGGGASIFIFGSNFGPGPTSANYAYFAARLSAVYGVVVENGPLPTLTFSPSACVVTVAHKELTCTSAAGAGRGLTFVVTLDGQTSVVPTISYGAPFISAVTDVNGQRVTTAAVSGGTQLWLIGGDFGPPGYGPGGNVSLVQSVTYGPTGSELVLPRASFVHVNHTALFVTLPPGSGSSLAFRVAVADQVSPASAATFSYAPPQLLAVAPATAHTYSNPAAPTLITLTAAALPLADTAAVVGVLFGNGASALPIVANVPVGPAAIAAATNGDGSVNIQFALPANGGGVGLGVALTISSTSGVLLSRTDVTSAAMTFSYLPPVMTDVVVTPAVWGTGGGAVPCPFGAPGFPAAPWTCADPTVHRLDIEGNDFGVFAAALPGQAAADRPDGVSRSLTLASVAAPPVGNATGGPGGAPLPFVLYSWTHTRIIAYAATTAGTVTVVTASTGWDAVVTTRTAAATFVNANPVVRVLTPNVTSPTAGGAVVSITAADLGGATALTLSVGPFPVTTIFDPRTSFTQPFASAAAAFTYYMSNPPTPPDAPVTIQFAVPPGQGRNVPVLVTRTVADGTTASSNSDATVSYLPPTVTGVAVVSGGGNGTSTPAPLGAPIVVPTDGSALLRITGANLGVAPTVFLGRDAVAAGAPAISPCPPPLGDTNACILVATPAGEGTGRQIADARFAGGFFLRVDTSGARPGATGPDTTLQSSPAFPLAYAPPVVTGVLPLSPARFPTRGGVLVNVTGANFGWTVATDVPAIAVAFGRADDGGGFVPCTAPTRWSHYSITCTLALGGGATLSARVTIADQTTTSAPVLSYNAPVITAVAIGTAPNSTAGNGTDPAPAWSAFPILRGPTSGAAFVTLSGTDFGALSPLNCVFLSWSNRDPTSAPVCNGVEDFLGEGEVPFAPNVVSWSHEAIVFRTIPGIGFRDVVLSVRGGGQNVTSLADPRVPRFRYNAPVVTGMTVVSGAAAGSGGPAGGPLLLDTEGGQVIMVTGANFGPTPYDTGSVPGTLTSQFAATHGPFNLTVAPTLPTAYLAVTLSRGCVSSARNIGGGRPLSTFVTTTAGSSLPLSACVDGIFNQTDTSFMFMSAPGVGAGLTLDVVVVDTGASSPNSGNVSSPVVSFSYLAPQPQAFLPNPVTVTPAAASFPVEITGEYFGDFDLANAQGWSTADRLVSGFVDGVACAAPRDGRYGNMDRRRENGNTILTCGVQSARVPAGYRGFVVEVAGQNGTVPAGNASQALLVVCGAGSYGRVGETCLNCPAQMPLAAASGADCAGYLAAAVGAGLTLNDRLSYPVPRAGWFNLNSSDAFWPAGPGSGRAAACPSPPDFRAGDAGRDVCVLPCDPPGACVGANWCAAGYASLAPKFRCADCAPKNYYSLGSPAFYRRGGACVQCPAGYQGIIVGYVVGIALVALAAYLTQRFGVHICSAFIGVDFFQVVALFGTTKVQWPASVSTLLTVLSSFYANVEIVAPECLDPSATFVTNFSGIVLLPLVFAAVLLIVHAALLFGKVVVMGRTGDVMRHSHTLVGAALVLVYLLYIYETRTLLAVFDCAPLTPSDGTDYMGAVPLEPCGTSGGVWAKLLAPSIIGLVVYTAGYPLAALALLWRNRELIMEDQLLRAKGVGDDRLTNPHAYDFRKRWGVLYSSFTPDACGWLLVVLVRKMLIALVPVLFNRNASYQMAACLIVLLCAYGLQLRVNPYLSPANAEGVLRSHAEASFTSPIHARLRSTIAGVESRGRKRTLRNVVDGTGRLDRGALLTLLSVWLLDPNTLEGSLLFAAAVVALMGIMFESQALDAGVYAGSRDAVSGVAIAVIIIGIIYYVAVIVTELWTVADTRSREAALRTRRRSSKSAGGSAGSASPGSKRGLTASGRAATRKQEEVNTGQLDVALNPLFTSAGSGSAAAAAAAAAAASSTSALDAVRAYSATAPPLDMWRVFASAFETQSVQSAAMAAELAAAKAELEQLRGDGGGGGGGRVGGPAGRRQEFAPQGAAGGADGGFGGARGAAAATPLSLATYRSSQSARFRAGGQE